MTAIAPAGLGREQGLSAACANACLVLAIAIPVTVAAFWTFGSWNTLGLVRLMPPDIIHVLRQDPQAWQRAAGGLICLVPVLILSFALLRARRSLMAFARGDFFAADVVDGLRDYAAASVWAAIAGIVSVPILSVAMTFTNTPGHRELSFDASGAQFLTLLGAVILWVIASAMARAAHVAREHQQFI